MTAARLSDPATSHEAANTVARHMWPQQQRVLGALTVLLWATDEQIADALPTINAGSVSKRRLELQRAGLVEPCGTGRTRSGCRAILWGLTPIGCRTARELAVAS